MARSRWKDHRSPQSSARRTLYKVLQLYFNQIKSHFYTVLDIIQYPVKTQTLYLHNLRRLFIYTILNVMFIRISVCNGWSLLFNSVWIFSEFFFLLYRNLSFFFICFPISKDFPFRQRKRSINVRKSQITMLKCTHHWCAVCPACTRNKMEVGGDCMVCIDLRSRIYSIQLTEK